MAMAVGITFKTSDKQAVAPEPPRPRDVQTHFVESLDAYSQQGCVEVLQGSPLNAADFCGTSNGFVMAVTEAYNRHHNLVLRPDDVWLAIVGQFGLFVNANAESLRHLFVDHQGQKQLTVSALGTLRTANYAALAQAMTGELRKNVRESSLCDWVLPDFSTTTSNDIVVGSVLLMATLKKYFQYKFCLLCGIPSVTLLGTVDDWEEVHRRVGELAKYGSECAKWCGMLKQVTSQLVESRKGEADMGFWSRVCHYSGGGSGPTYLSGWITAFCVFNEDGKWQGGKGPGFPRVDTEDIPPGYLTVEVVVDDNGCSYDTLMFAGHLGYDIVGRDRTGLAPKVAWAIARRDKSKAEKEGVPSEDEL